MDLDRKTIEKDEEYLRQVSTNVAFEKDNVMEYIAKLKEYCKDNTVFCIRTCSNWNTKKINLYKEYFTKYGK